MPVPPEAVWEALADPSGYEYWVVGSKVIRDAEPGFPAPGTKFHHTIGFGPFTLNDHTEVLEAERPAAAEAAGEGPSARHGVGDAADDAGRTAGRRSRWSSGPTGRTRSSTLNPLLHVLTKVRNAESLMRLEELALRR